MSIIPQFFLKYPIEANKQNQIYTYIIHFVHLYQQQQ